MIHRFLHVLCGLLAVATPTSPQQTEWKDPSPHTVKLVTVDDGRAAGGAGLGRLRPGARSPGGGWRYGARVRRSCPDADRSVPRHRRDAARSSGLICTRHRLRSRSSGRRCRARHRCRRREDPGRDRPFVRRRRDARPGRAPLPRESQGWCMSMRRSIVETTLTTKPTMRWRERCPLLPVPRQMTWRPSRLCVRIWRNTAAPGPRRTCGPGPQRILTEPSQASVPDRPIVRR